MKMNSPKIRFKGYTEDWEQRKLGELGTVQTCKRIFKEQTSEKGDIPFFKNGTIGLEPDSYISREMYEEFRRLYPYPEVGDTLISVVGSIGRTAEYTGKDEYFQDSNVVWLKTDGSINKKFLKISYQVIKWLIEGSTVKHLYNDNILRSEIVMPVSQIEQAKIAEFFEELDHLITLHQRKCEQTKTLKKYMLQKMFPQEGQKVPEIRFEGFTGDWEQRKLDDVTVKIGSGKTPSGGENAYVDAGIPLIRSQNVNDNKVDFEDIVYIDESTDKLMMNSRVFANDVLLNITGASIGRSAVYKGLDEANVNQHVCIIRPIEGYHPDFIQLNLASDRGQKQIKSSQAGGGREGLNFQQIGKMEFVFPTLDEQKQIGNYFNNIDHLITLHQREYEKLQELKKFMLQNMFV